MSSNNSIVASDEEIKSHIENQVATRVAKSPIYAFLFTDCLRITECSKGLVRARITLEHRHMNSGGGIHGSVSATIVDWAGGMAIASYDLRDKTGLSVDIHVTYLSTAKEGETIEIEGRAGRVGGSLAFTNIKITKVVDGELGPIVATGTHTKYVQKR
ncbi:Thioesterase/thiol ester dehydrase-isomerase [Rhizodiscina lignyota]|uniref:Thioesterase/thiol ester dehydrase-isomerase n=1 Tax=Rhizodiscina lignyota TaxID=1504668 RepID=A0A9P4IMG7_9PEZI|nr:Thioesterase/thiol ester dehydrase-isomerase [Rhizodiscina lignyota]